VSNRGQILYRKLRPPGRMVYINLWMLSLSWIATATLTLMIIWGSFSVFMSEDVSIKLWIAFSASVMTGILSIVSSIRYAIRISL
jgi:hypothetical protein